MKLLSSLLLLLAAVALSFTQVSSFSCPTDSGYYPHEDCWKFWQCGNGIAYEMVCQNNKTQWNQTILTCDHISDCVRPDAPEEDIQTTLAPEDGETTTDNGGEVGGEPTQGPSDAFKCPEESGYYPHENCWQFWQCGNGLAYEMTCANGTQWNQTILTCDHISDCLRPPQSPQTTLAPVSDEPTTEDGGNEVTNEPSTQPPPEPTTEGSDDSTTLPPPSEGFKCPNASGYYPHENCWQFWQCGNGIAYEMTCGNKTQWNQTILTCDHISDCVRPDVPPPTSVPITTLSPADPTTEDSGDNVTGEPSTQPPPEPTTQGTTQGPSDAFKCPEESGYYPHENCWQFWQCGNGLAYEMTCPNRTQWNQTILTCDHISDCVRPDVPSPVTTTLAPADPTTEDSGDEVTNGPSTQPPPEPTTEAPVDPTTEDNNDEVTGEPSTQPPPEPTTEGSDNPTTLPPPSEGFKCPNASGYFPHENCWQFWQCGNGIAYEMTCANGTQWNQTILTCDHITDCVRPPQNPQTTLAPVTDEPTTEGNDETMKPTTQSPPEQTTTLAPVDPTTEDNDDEVTDGPSTQPPPEPTTEGPADPTTQGTTQGSSDGFKCPDESGYYPHENCWQFWQCGNWIAYEMTCANGTQWNQTILTCDHISDCLRPPQSPQTTLAPEQEPTTEGNEVTDEPSTQPPPKPTTDVPVDPTTEDNGNEVTDGPSTQAPQDPTTEDNENEVTDGPSTQPPPEPTTEGNENEITDEPSTQPPPEPTTTQQPPSDGFKCPDESGYYPHENCWQFWQCGNWIAYEMTCANGTQWNQTILTCDHISDCLRPPQNPQTTLAPVTDEPTTERNDDEVTDAPSTQLPPAEPTTEDSEDEETNSPTTQPPPEPTTEDNEDEVTNEPSTQPPPEPTTEGTTLPPPSEGFKCPEESGYYPHENCWQFWQCGNGIAYEMTCANGTQWNQTILTCDHITDCVRPPQNPQTTLAPEQELTTEGNEVTDEPSTQPPPKPISTTLAPADPTTEDNDDEVTNAPSTQPPPEPTTEGPSEPTTEDNDAEVTNEPSTQPPPEPTTEGSDDSTTLPPPSEGFKCPNASGYYPHENCWQFWQCGNGIAYEMTCANGTQWNQTILTCDHITDCLRPDVPQNPQTTLAPVTDEPTTEGNDDDETSAPSTQPPSEPTTTLAPVDSTTEDNDDEETSAPSTQPPPEPTTTLAPADSTTEDNDDEGTTLPPPSDGFKCPNASGYYPHENCWQFWQCGNGIAYEMTCGNKTQWNQTILTCDHISDCVRPDVPPPTSVPITTLAPTNPPTTQPPTNPPTTQPPTNPPTTQPPTNPPTTAPPTQPPTKPPTTTTTTKAPVPDFRCPTQSGYYPHKDCWKFWQCGNGIAYEKTCPPYTQWNQTITTCDWQRTCRRPDSPWPPAYPTGAPPPMETDAPTSAPTGPTTPEPAPEVFKCPGSYGFYPHKNCWQYWQCGNGIAYEMTCGRNTMWEQRFTTCIHLNNSVCRRPQSWFESLFG